MRRTWCSRVVNDRWSSERGTLVLLHRVVIRRRVRRGRLVACGQPDQYEEEAAQAVLGIGTGIEMDTYHPQVRGIPAGADRSCLALGFFQVDALVPCLMILPPRRRSQALR